MNFMTNGMTKMTTDNLFERVLLASARARELRREENRTYELGKNHGPSACVRAWQEVQEGSFTWKQLKEQTQKNSSWQENSKAVLSVINVLQAQEVLAKLAKTTCKNY